MSHPEAYAIGIFCDSAVMTVPCGYLTLKRAKAYARAYNRTYDDHSPRDAAG